MKPPRNLKSSPHLPIFLETFKYLKDILIFVVVRPGIKISGASNLKS